MGRNCYLRSGQNLNCHLSGGDAFFLAESFGLRSEKFPDRWVMD